MEISGGEERKIGGIVFCPVNVKIYKSKKNPNSYESGLIYIKFKTVDYPRATRLKPVISTLCSLT